MPWAAEFRAAAQVVVDSAEVDRAVKAVPDVKVVKVVKVAPDVRAAVKVDSDDARQQTRVNCRTVRTSEIFEPVQGIISVHRFLSFSDRCFQSIQTILFVSILTRASPNAVKRLFQGKYCSFNPWPRGQAVAGHVNLASRPRVKREKTLHGVGLRP